MSKENQYRKIVSEAIDNKNKKTPIYKGCDNKQCFCTGACKEIIGFVEDKKSINPNADIERHPLPITNKKMWDMAILIVGRIKNAAEGKAEELTDRDYKELEGEWFDWLEEELLGEQK